MVGMRLERCVDELLDQAADGIAVGAHAALFDDDVALFVELAHDGMQEALGFEIGPEFEAVRREGVEVIGLVVAGVGVHALAAFALDDLAKFVGLDVFVGFRDGVFPGFFKFLELVVVAADALVALRDVVGIRDLNLGESGLFGGIVGGADLVGALEGHVLEHVGQAGFAHGVLNGAGVDVCEEREHRRFRALAG